MKIVGYLVESYFISREHSEHVGSGGKAGQDLEGLQRGHRDGRHHHRGPPGLEVAAGPGGFCACWTTEGISLDRDCQTRQES